MKSVAGRKNAVNLAPRCHVIPAALLIFLFVTAFMVNHAEGAEDKVSVIHFAEEANWPPFTPNRFGMTEEGLSFRLMQAVFSRLGIEITVELFPQRRLLEILKQGDKDGAPVISKDAERLKYLTFTDPIFSKRGFVYYLTSRKSPLQWNDVSDLQGLKIGITAGHNYGEEFHRAASRNHLGLVEVNTEEQGFHMLLAGRIDVFLCIDMTARQILRDPKYRGVIVHAPKSYYHKDYHIAFSKKSRAEKLTPKVNEVIRAMKEDGSLPRLLFPYVE